MTQVSLAGVPPPKYFRQAPSRLLSNLFTVSLLPWMVFTLVLLLFTFAFEELQPLIWALVVSCSFLAFLFVAMGSASGRSADVALGFLVLVSVAFAVPIGMLAWSQYMVEFVRLDSGASYSNVSPFEYSTTHADATILQFVTGTYVNTTESIGFLMSGNLYCVAPVVSSTGPTTPQYWAVGVDCCGLRGTFTCGDVGDPLALAAVVAYNELGAYSKAVRMAESIYGIPPSSHSPLFLKWTANPTKLVTKLRTSAIVLVTVSSCVYLLVCALLGHFLAKSVLR